MKLIRGYLALIVVFGGLLLSDLVLRLVVVPWVHLRPSSRERVLAGFIRSMAWLVTRPVEVLSGASIEGPPEIPAEPGTLILMNHQSLFDIPLVVKAVTGGYPVIVTRRRYARWIPLISLITRVYQYPIVDPSANTSDARQMLKTLRKVARETDMPLTIFPEGHRSRDGEIGPFAPKGMSLILKARPWTVHVMVADGYWQHGKLKQMLGGMGDMRGRIRYVGRFEWTDPRGDVDAFAEEMRGHMVETLAEMRSAASV